MGKPQALKAPLDGYFSRRINADHRLVYRFDAGVVTIAQCRTSLFELPKKVHSIDLSAEEIQYEMGMVSTMIKDGGDVA